MSCYRMGPTKMLALFSGDVSVRANHANLRDFTSSPTFHNARLAHSSTVHPRVPIYRPICPLPSLLFPPPPRSLFCAWRTGMARGDGADSSCIASVPPPNISGDTAAAAAALVGCWPAQTPMSTQDTSAGAVWRARSMRAPLATSRAMRRPPDATTTS